MTAWKLPAKTTLGLSLALALLGSSACTTLVSGGRQIPVEPGDSVSIEEAHEKVFAPNMLFQDDPQRVPVLLSFAFDGTLNDERRVPEGERPTVVSYIAGRVAGTQYYPGVGMQKARVDPLDAALGYTMVATAQTASERFFSQAEVIVREHPQAQLRVFVTGFSRGAASARHFMNIVDEQWRRRFAATQPGDGPTLRFYALLYDSVSTGYGTGIQLALPRTLNYSLHLVARDEPRGLFPVDIDTPTRADSLVETFYPRINTLILPGAHSDVGMSYSQGLGDEYRALTDRVLAQLGLIPETCFEVLNEPALDGKHDSRGDVDRWLRRPVAGGATPIVRTIRQVPPIALTPADSRDIQQSLERLSAPNLGRVFELNRVDTPTFSFTALRQGSHLELLNVSKSLAPSTVSLQSNGAGGADFKFAFGVMPSATSHLVVPAGVIRQLKPQGSVVDVVYLRIAQGKRFYFYVDGVVTDYVDHPIIQTTSVNERLRCRDRR